MGCSRIPWQASRMLLIESKLQRCQQVRHYEDREFLKGA
jgi:hypothetical protein